MPVPPASPVSSYFVFPSPLPTGITETFPQYSVVSPVCVPPPVVSSTQVEPTGSHMWECPPSDLEDDDDSPGLDAASLQGPSPEPIKDRSLTAVARDAWLSQQSPRVRALVEQPFGKETLSQFFLSEARLRHILHPLARLGFLSKDCWSRFSAAFSWVGDFLALRQEMSAVAFADIRGFRHDDFEADTTIDPVRVAKVTSALFHFDGDPAALIRWIGGSHVGAHCDAQERLDRLTPILPADLALELTRLVKFGSPRLCRVLASERNFQVFYNYGNHATVDVDPSKTFGALVKDTKRGYVLPFDRRAIPFVLNCHVTPQGMVDLDKPGKKPRPIFDSSFRPAPWATAINDWTNKENEPPIHCVATEVLFMSWLWNLRISYPTLAIYIGDDDISGAFRWLRYHPNLVGLHTSVQGGFAVFNTGGTFGDNTSPSNWDILARTRQCSSRHHWLHNPKVIEQAAQYLPPLAFEPSCPSVVFSPAQADTINCGVFGPDGSRLPPQFDHHVDDNMYADVGQFMERTVSASVIGLYETLGYPSPIIPNPLSRDKFNATYTQQRCCVGRLFDSARMTVGMTSDKRIAMIASLHAWLALPNFSLLDAAGILGKLENHTRYVPWARPWFFVLQDELRTQLRAQAHHLARSSRRRQQLLHRTLQRDLPRSLWSRIGSLVSKDHARRLWHSQRRSVLSAAARATSIQICNYLTESQYPWESPIGLVVPRSPHATSYGDASLLGAGGYCPTWSYWFMVPWHADIRQRLRLPKSHPEHLHINAMEFLCVIIQFVAFHCYIEAFPHFFHESGLPVLPIFETFTDNTTAKSWAQHATTCSHRGRGLINIYCSLLHRFPSRLDMQHVAGIDNVIADALSRPSDPSSPFSLLCSQFLLQHPRLQRWHVFLPSPELLELLFSGLSTTVLQEHPPGLRSFGRFVLAESITCNGVLPST